MRGEKYIQLYIFQHLNFLFNLSISSLNLIFFLLLLFPNFFLCLPPIFQSVLIFLAIFYYLNFLSEISHWWLTSRDTSKPSCRVTTDRLTLYTKPSGCDTDSSTSPLSLSLIKDDFRNSSQETKPSPCKKNTAAGLKSFFHEACCIWNFCIRAHMYAHTRTHTHTLSLWREEKRARQWNIFWRCLLFVGRKHNGLRTTDWIEVNIIFYLSYLREGQNSTSQN